MSKLELNIVIISSVILIFFAAFVGGYSHEEDLIRHCIEEGTLHTWDSSYDFECKAKIPEKTR